MKYFRKLHGTKKEAEIKYYMKRFGDEEIVEITKEQAAKRLCVEGSVYYEEQKSYMEKELKLSSKEHPMVGRDCWIWGEMKK